MNDTPIEIYPEKKETEIISVLPSLPFELARLRELESEIRRELRGFLVVGAAFLEIREKKLYKLKFDTFEDYCKKVWDITERMFRYISDGYKVVENLNKCSEFRLRPSREAQVRPMVRLKPQQQVMVWKIALERCPEDQEPTASLIIDVVAEVAPPKPKAPADAGKKDDFPETVNITAVDFKWFVAQMSAENIDELAGIAAKYTGDVKKILTEKMTLIAEEMKHAN